jgi:outer membrane protein assembly factor BamA
LCAVFTSYGQINEIHKVEIQGLKKTKSSFIKKYLVTQPGSVLDSTVIEKDIIRLKRLPLVSHATYQVFYSHENQYNVFFNIEENFTIIPDINIWTAVDQQFAFRVGAYDFNFLGNGITFGGFYQNNGYDTYSASFRAPYLFSRKFGLSINFQDWKSEEPLFLGDNSVANYLYNNISFDVNALIEFNFSHKLEAGLNYFTEEYTYLEGATQEGVPLDFKIDKLMLKIFYDYDRLNYHFQYVEGFRSNLYLQYVNSANEFQDEFFIAWNDFLYFKRLGNRGNWANRLRLGLSSNDDSPFAPFSVDNNLNIRGVGNIIDRGTGVIVLNTEYRHTLIDKKWFVLQSNVFIDSGSWRNPGGDFSI